MKRRSVSSLSVRKVNKGKAGNTAGKAFFMMLLYVMMYQVGATAQNPMSGTFTIGANGQYGTFNQAITDLELRKIGGDVVFVVESGIYPETIYINWILTAEAQAHIHTHSVTFTSQSGNAEDVVITAGGFNVEYVIKLHHHANRVTFENMTIAATNSNTTPLVLTGSVNQRFSGLVFEGFKPGIYSWGGFNRGLIIENCVFRGGGIQLLGAASEFGLRDLHIVGNLFERSGISINNLRGFYSLRNNYITHTNTGIRIQGSAFFGEIINNYVRVESGSTVQPIILHTLDSVAVYHNTLKAVSPGGALQVWGDTKVNLRNNILYSTRSRIIDVKMGVLHSDYNAFYTHEEPAFMMPEATYSSFSAYRDAMGTDAGSVFMDPVFNANATTPMGAMVPGIAELMEAGTDLLEWVADDFFGTVRSTTPSIGALEYDGTFVLPVAPELTSPAHFSVKLPIWPFLKWQGKGIVNYFELEVATDEQFEEIKFSKSLIDHSQTLVNKSLEPNTSYWWRVRSVNGMGESEWTPAWQFTTYNGPGRSEDVSTGKTEFIFGDLFLSVHFLEFDNDVFFAASMFPSDEETIPNDAGSIGNVYWTLDQEGATVFTAKVCFDIPTLDQEIAPDQVLIWKRGGAGEDWVEQTVVLNSGQGESFEACVEVNSFSDFIITLSPSTGLHPAAGNLSGLSVRQNFPNPFSGFTVIGYEIGAGGHVLVEVFNSAGQRLATLIDELRDPGFYEIHWEAPSLSGIYFYRVVYTNSETRQIAVRPMILR